MRRPDLFAQVGNAEVGDFAEEVDASGLPFLSRAKTLAPREWNQDALIGQGSLGGAAYGGMMGSIPNSGALPNVVTTNSTSQATYTSASQVLAN